MLEPEQFIEETPDRSVPSTTDEVEKIVAEVPVDGDIIVPPGTFYHGGKPFTGDPNPGIFITPNRILAATHLRSPGSVIQLFHTREPLRTIPMYTPLTGAQKRVLLEATSEDVRPAVEKALLTEDINLFQLIEAFGARKGDPEWEVRFRNTLLSVGYAATASGDYNGTPEIVQVFAAERLSRTNPNSAE